LRVIQMCKRLISTPSLLRVSSSRTQCPHAQSQGHTRKIRPWDESILVPFVLRYPALLGRPQRVIDAPFGAPDVMPTLLDLAGTEVPGTVEGTSFAPLLCNGSKVVPDGAVIACYQPFANWHRTLGGREWRGIRTSRYTYVRDLKGPWLLYDNREDPYQLSNLCNTPQASEVQSRLDDKLTELLRRQNDRFEPGEALLAKWNYVEVNSHTYRTVRRSSQ
jgi:arylsulfatase A-like enzyme